MSGSTRVISVILATDFGNLGMFVIAMPALGLALLAGLIGALKRWRWLIIASSMVSLLTAASLFVAAHSIGAESPHIARDIAELNFLVAGALGLGLMTLLGLLLPRD